MGRRGLIVLSSLVLTVAALSPATAPGKPKGTDRSCKGVQSGTGIDTPSGPGVLTHVGIGSGRAPHLGRFTFRADHTTTTATGTIVGAFTTTAANGDLITGTYSGVIEPTPNPEILKFRLDITNTGGTGRFAGATGTSTSIGTTTIVSVDPTTGVIRSQSEAIICGTSNDADAEDD